MIEAGPEQPSETGPRSRSKPTAWRACAIAVVCDCPTGIASHGTDFSAMQTPPPSWSVAAIMRWSETPRICWITEDICCGVEALWFRLTIRRPPYWCTFQSVSTAGVTVPWKPTIITAPISWSRVSPPGPTGDGLGSGGGEAAGCVEGDEASAEGEPPPHATSIPAASARARSLLKRFWSTGDNAGRRRRFLARVPARLQFADHRVHRVDELLDVVLTHRSEERAHSAGRHQHAVVDQAEEKISGLLLVGGRHRAVVDHWPVGEMKREHGACAVHLHRLLVRGEDL